MVHQRRNHRDAAGVLDLFDQTLNEDVLALATLLDSLGIGQVEHQLFRLGIVEMLLPGQEHDDVVLRLVMTFEGFSQHHLHLSQTINQAA